MQSVDFEQHWYFPVVVVSPESTVETKKLDEIFRARYQPEGTELRAPDGNDMCKPKIHMSFAKREVPRSFGSEVFIEVFHANFASLLLYLDRTRCVL